MRRWGIMVAAWALALGAGAPGRAQTPPSAASSGPPDVLVLVYQQPGRGDLVGITYAHTVSHAQAERDLAALAQATGWPIGPSPITDGTPAVRKKVAPMTSTSFTVPGVVQENQALPVEPFITAFRSYKRLALIFSVGGAFQFQGPRNSADSNVQVALEQRGTVYSYQVRVFNPQFTHLSLTQPSAASVHASSRRAFSWVPFLGLLACAGTAGVLVYVLMARKSGPPLADTKALAEEQTKTEQTKIGVKG